MSAASAVLFFVLVALGFTVTGIVGFGANVLMMPILSMVFPIQDLVLIFALISFVNASYRVVESRRGILWRPFLRMVLVSMAGTVLGLWVFRLLPELWLKLLLGCFVVAMAVYHLTARWRAPLQNTVPTDSAMRHVLYQVLLFVGGFLHGSFVCGGPMYVIYCSHYYGSNRDHFRGMQFGIVFVNSVLIMLINLWHGAYTEKLFLPSVLGIIGLIAAFFISAVVMKHLRDTSFYLLVQIVLLLSGVSLCWQSATKLFF